MSENTGPCKCELCGEIKVPDDMAIATVCIECVEDDE